MLTWSLFDNGVTVASASVTTWDAGAAATSAVVSSGGAAGSTTHTSGSGAGATTSKAGLAPTSAVVNGGGSSSGTPVPASTTAASEGGARTLLDCSENAAMNALVIVAWAGDVRPSLKNTR